MWEAAAIVLIVAGICVVDSRRAREARSRRALGVRALCAAVSRWDGVFRSLRLARDEEGRLRIVRYLTFEFPSPGNTGATARS